MVTKEEEEKVEQQDHNLCHIISGEKSRDCVIV